MAELSMQERAEVDALARQTRFSADAIETMLDSVARGGGRMAQFDHPEFGGAGQWMRGGMLMLSDLFDSDMRRRVEQLCEALAIRVVREPGLATSGQHQRQSQTANGITHVQESRDPAFMARDEPWYPASLGVPAASGAQNDARYAWFADSHRLVIDDGHGVTVYDTGDHAIGGVAQQQGARGTVTFVSQHGTVDVDRLPVIETPSHEPVRTTTDPFLALEKLAALHARGILDDGEFAAKKAELLERI